MSSCAFIGIRPAFRKPVACVFSHTQAYRSLRRLELPSRLVKGCWQNSSTGVSGLDMPCTAFHIPGMSITASHRQCVVPYGGSDNTMSAVMPSSAGAAHRVHRPGKGRNRHRDGGVRRSDSWVSSSFRFHKQSRRSKRISSPHINSSAYIVRSSPLRITRIRASVHRR